ncbi:MAG TPA: beta-N-acetylhexosaminidase [Chitinophagales bacterium]|nr:beta-N-acetylhexosaminidase [Chitinophagales bacterium]HNL85388.1 beta-N-acetylhexosaminidase [Chitinophagales bacterium]
MNIKRNNTRMMSSIRIALFMLVSYLGNALFAGEINLTPQPNSIHFSEGKFTYKKGIEVKITRGDNDTKYVQNQLSSFLKSENIPQIQFSNNLLFLNLLKENTIPNDGYELKIQPTQISITSSSNAGLFYGVQTLMQLINFDSTNSALSCMEIKDEPAFAYRGFHLDVARHFFDVDVVKSYLDAMAKLKLNTFHWHLTDDQGWRIEIKKYPKLTETTNAQRKGYYTQEQIKDIVQYAKERFITVIPEIDMPGHSSAAIVAYPYLGCYNQTIDLPQSWGIKADILCPDDTTMRFVKDVLDEVCTLFPSPYIHVGGDEVNTKHWKESAEAKDIQVKQGLKNVTEIKTYFTKEIQKYLATKNKKIIGWGEIADDKIDKDIVVMSWRNNKAAIKAAKNGNPVILAPRQFCYLDYMQYWDEEKKNFVYLYLPLDKAYKFNPLSKLKSHADKVLGGEACVWTAYIETENQLKNQVFPRLIAIAECLWTKPENKSYSNFTNRLDKQNNYFYKEDIMHEEYDNVHIKPKKKQ